ncbi:MAG: enterotoxin [Candidatus Acidiferrales bacterium]
MKPKQPKQSLHDRLRAARNELSRRDFLSQAALLTGALPAVGYLSHFDTAPASAMQSTAAKAQANIQGKIASLRNRVISAEWEISPKGLRLIRVKDGTSGQTIGEQGPAFALLIRGDSGEVVSSAMKLIGSPRVEMLEANPAASRFCERVNGRAVSATLEDVRHRVRVYWRAILRDGSHYIRQEIALEAIAGDLPVDRITLMDLSGRGPEVAGSVKGSPITRGNWFFGLEHPLSASKVEGNRATCSINRHLPLAHGKTATYSSVIGVTDTGQLRRGFLRYIERERAHPYRTFLHYNSWFDLGYFTPYDQTGALGVINAFGRELREKRGVVLDSFLFDDGWDDHNSLWKFNSGFPHGFAPLRTDAAKYGAAPGIWLSPWGGYDGPRKQRLAYGKLHGFEESSDGFVLSGPRYFRRFHEVCMDMVRKYGVNQFKFDGTADTSTVYPGSKFNSDFDAMISLIEDLRAAEKNLYVNLTSGTYPSPFWLRYADSTWRGGEDDSFTGVGSDRQQWITYRDAATHEHVVRSGPLYPLNSLMLHGLIYARHAKRLDTDTGHDFPSEVHSYFGTGTQLQEMYITPSLLLGPDWDVLAEAASWSRRNADILVDTHWIGGDPAKLEVYGWASWSPRGGIITLRNPNKVPQTYALDVQSAFELPEGAAESYSARSPWKNAVGTPSVKLRARDTRIINLKPFEVLTLEATPR